MDTDREALASAALLAARDDPLAYCLLTSRGQYRHAPHQAFLLHEIQRVAQIGGRIIISVAVRHTKSVSGSQVFPSWWIGNHPRERIIIGTSEAGLSTTFSGKARDLLAEWGPSIFGVAVDPASRSRSRWNTNLNGHMLDGGMTAVGRNGSPEGRGGSIIIDDPYRSFIDAMSPLTREQVKEWWLNTLRPRMEPGSFAVVLCARWHEDDLSGFLMREYGERWEEIRMPAICDSENDPMGRQIGEALWPEQWSVERLEQAREEVSSIDGSATWMARYQQTPLSLSSRMFPPDQWAWIEPDDLMLTKVKAWVTAWDLAATEGGGDWTVGVTMGRLPDNRIIIRDVIRGRWGSDRRDKTMRTATEQNGSSCVVRIPQDPGAAGKVEVTRLKRLLAPFRVIAERPTGSKAVRAAGWASCVQSGSALIVRSEMARQLVASHSNFTGKDGGQDDDIDAAADAYNFLFRQSSSVSGTGASYV